MGQIGLTVLIISGISGFLALILSFADKFIADYGEVELLINSEDPIIVEGGNTLLATLRDEEIYIPSACGGKGTCGFCKVIILEGGGPLLATEKPLLTEEEMEKDVRMACQVKVKENIKIKVPEEILNVKEYVTTLVKKTPLTDKITLFRFEMPEGETIDFKPGQYVQIMAPSYPAGEGYEGSDEDVIRAYSIASSRLDTNHIELLIGYTKGICSTYCHKVLKEGDKVSITGPFGDFYYLDEDTDIILGAGGTGFAPIRSIMYHLKDQNIERKARFFFGARTPDDLFLLDEIDMFEKELYDFKFIPTLSRTTEEMNWKGYTGHADKTIKEVVDPEGYYTGYLCGSPRMIQSMSAALKEVGLEEKDIHFDDFA